MKNTLRYALIGLGVLLIGLGVFAILFTSYFEGTLFAEFGQSLAVVIFGGLLLISGLAYKRR